MPQNNSLVLSCLQGYSSPYTYISSKRGFFGRHCIIYLYHGQFKINVYLRYYKVSTFSNIVKQNKLFTSLFPYCTRFIPPGQQLSCYITAKESPQAVRTFKSEIVLLILHSQWLLECLMCIRCSVVGC